MSQVKQYYDQRYNDRPDMFGVEPDLVVKLAARWAKGTALELGCGQGRNAFFLAAKGFDVTAVDISSVGIAQLEQRARDTGIAVHARIGDITTFDIAQPVDLIVSTYALHHIEHDVAIASIAHWKDRTSPGGFHAIAAFTREGDFFRRNPATTDFYPDRELLRDLYHDWKIRHHRIGRGKAAQQRPDGTHMENVAVRIIAQRPA